MRTLMVGMAVLLLASCSGGAGNNAAAPAAPAAPALDATQQRIVAMSEGERNAVLIQAIRGAGQACQHVDASQAIDNPGGGPSYLATCDGRARYAVTIGPGGNGAVTSVRGQGR